MRRRRRQSRRCSPNGRNWEAGAAAVARARSMPRMVERPAGAFHDLQGHGPAAWRRARFLYDGRPTTRVFNFSPGPATLPEPVLRQAASEMLDWHGSGMSAMEMSHRGKEFMAIHAEAEALVRELLGVPANYKVLF